MRRLIRNKLNIESHKRLDAGFTLVELVIVLALLAIILSITITGGLAWQDWSRFQHQDTVAEELFFAAQNQLTEYDASYAIRRQVKDKLQIPNASGKYEYNEKYVLASPDSAERLEQIVYKDGSDGQGATYDWSKIWEAVPENDPDSQNATIISLYAQKGDYDRYLAARSTSTAVAGLDAGTVLLFDIIASYVSDTSVLNGAILLEFSPEAGQVFSVCYSDQQSSFVTKSGSSVSYLDVANDRRIHARNSNMVGYYCADYLYEKLKGRSSSESNLILEFKNEEALTMVLTAPSGDDLAAGDALEIVLYDGDNGAEQDPAMVLSMKYLNPTSEYLVYSADSIADAAEHPTKVSVTLKKGIYQSETPRDMWIPIWLEENGEEKSLHFVLDAADLQAQSSILYKAEIESNEDAQSAMRNTYSFYRFGLSDCVNYVFGSVKSTSFETGVESTAFSKKRVLPDSQHPDGLVSHLESDGANENRTTGVCTTFGDYTILASDKNSRRITIQNARHLYNIRFESDHKRNLIHKNVFMLENDIDWFTFVGKKEKPGTMGMPAYDSGTNYFLNSYGRKDENGADIISGINYKGNNKATDGSGVETDLDLDTAHVPFPGFLKLDKNDTFTQTIAEGQTAHKISNLEISFAANIVYGVYDNVFEDDTIEEWFKKVDPDTNLNRIMLECKEDSDYSGILGVASATDDSSGSRLARAGLLPVGLFAENFGQITDIVLDHHVVRGMQALDDGTIIYTCMAGGFVGNNMGVVDRLTLLDSNETDGLATKVNGLLDVGGIIGRQSFAAAAATKVNISNMTNEGTVTGYENVGGIVGRVYVHYLNDQNNVDQIGGNFNDSSRKRYYHDGYYVTDSGLSASGLSAYRAESVSVTDCVNTGRVSGDELIYGGEEGNEAYTLDGVSVLNSGSYMHCAFIGGIAGSVQDGCICDSAAAGTNPLNQYWEKGFYDGDFAYVTVNHCVSKSLYTQAEIDAFPSNRSKNISVNKDCYVGGLIGYARLANIVDCNGETEAESKDYYADGAEGYPVVAGRRYVGGVTGCADECIFRASSGYAATNYNLVLGERYVGGISGAFGAGDSQPASLDFRNPAQNEAGNPSSIFAVERGDFIKRLLNRGIVLGWRSGKAFEGGTDEDGIKSTTAFGSGMIGGIVGESCVSVQRVVNRQAESTKAYMLKLVGFRNSAIDAETVTGVTESTNTPYGGNGVGGIAGSMSEQAYLDRAESGTRTRSDVDAVVYGQDNVGGGIGIHTAGENKAFNIFLTAEESGTGTLVLGRDSVGGIIGCAAGLYNDPSADEIRNRMDDTSITSAYKVVGRYGVGGVCGTLVKKETTQPAVKAQVVIPTENEKAQVLGIAYVGGFAGVSEVEEPNVAGTLSGIVVSAKYYAGGYFGAMMDAVSVQILNANAASVNSAEITAEIFAGGFAGLYSVNASEDHFSATTDQGTKNAGLLHDIAATYLRNAGSYQEAGNVFSVLINAGDLASADIFKVNTTGDYSFDFSTFATPLSVSIRAKLFAGGLYGYLPERMKVGINGFTNRASVYASSAVDASADSTGLSGEKFAYLGGVLGRVPEKVTLTSCTNNATGEYADDKEYYYDAPAASYLGGLTEVNHGLITGESEGKPCLNSVAREYTSVSAGAFAGVNAGNITFCNNTKPVSGLMAAGIAVVSTKNSSITKCANLDVVTGQNLAAGIVAVTASENGSQVTVSDCVNQAKVSTSAGKAAGLIGRNTGSLTSENCNNTGKVNAAGTGAAAAGILCENVQGGTFSIKNAVNTASVTIAGNSSPNTAGIVYTTGSAGILELCRNYGSGIAHAISASTANRIRYCFDATGASDHIGSVSDTSQKYANFYIDKQLDEHDYAFSVKRGYYTTYVIPKQEYSGKNLLNTSGDMVDPVVIDGQVLAPDQTDSDIQHVDGSATNVKKGNQMLTYEIYNMKDANEWFFPVDGFSIVWDNYDSSETEYADEKTVHYNINLLDSEGRKLYVAPMEVKIPVDGPLTQDFDLNEFINVLNRQARINGQDYAVSKDQNFDKNAISRITIIIRDSDVDDQTVGIRAFKWKADAETESTVMPSVDPSFTPDPYCSNSIRTVMTYIMGGEGRTPEPESVLYPTQEVYDPYTLGLHGADTPISQLRVNPRNFDSIYNVSEREEFIAAIDAKYIEFISEYITP